MSFRIITEPTIIPLTEPTFMPKGLNALVRYLHEHAPECLPADVDLSALDVAGFYAARLLWPEVPARFSTIGQGSSEAESLVELAGRTCYKSFGQKAGRKSNAEYIANLLGAPGKLPHASVTYHPKMTFFFGGMSRRMSHELIRHYVGADRSEEGCPSQESTRYTEHPGHFVAHPRILRADEATQHAFAMAMRDAYKAYSDYLSDEVEAWKVGHGGEEPKGMDRKRIYEAAASYLPGAAATSMVWSGNPTSLAKMFAERCDEAADLEFQRFAKKLREVCHSMWPALFRDSNPAVEL